MTELQRRLFELQDKKYQTFHSKLIPNIEPAHVIGIRTPVLRNFAKAFAKEDGAEAFLQELFGVRKIVRMRDMAGAVIGHAALGIADHFLHKNA